MSAYTSAIFVSTRQKSEIKRKFRMPSGKRRVHSISGRHDDDCLRNAPGVFRRASKPFLISNLYRVVTEIAEVYADIARIFLKCIMPLLP